MLAWIGEFGDLAGSESRAPGCYGADMTRHFAKAGVMIPEVDRPDRSHAVPLIRSVDS
ncbi:hypothetical protein [Pseudarthrobacter sp. NIBRBAC000502772]|uniref:hypothetical protein n=1 Tax=Pseudarthrobacter sp. NIBRBAC000502772 TaxID=2590775 RepID=UPI001AEF94E7|nr:hypothetical protein [Pseudarthrobacter sp. NIBRBAC000502772]